MSDLRQVLRQGESRTLVRQGMGCEPWNHKKNSFWWFIPLTTDLRLPCASVITSGDDVTDVTSLKMMHGTTTTYVILVIYPVCGCGTHFSRNGDVSWLTSHDVMSLDVWGYFKWCASPRFSRDSSRCGLWIRFRRHAMTSRGNITWRDVVSGDVRDGDVTLYLDDYPTGARLHFARSGGRHQVLPRARRRKTQRRKRKSKSSTGTFLDSR